MTPAERVAFWNLEVGLDAPVLFGPHDQRRRTRAAAMVLSDGRPVVWLHDVVGAVDLDMVRVP